MANNRQSSVVGSALLTIAGTFVIGSLGLIIVSAIAIGGGGHIPDLSRNLYSSPGTWLMLALSVQLGVRLGQYYYRKKDIIVTAASQKSAKVTAIILWFVFFGFLLATSIRHWK